MKQELYLNLKTSWQSIWDVVRLWILHNRGTQFKPTGDIPQRRPSGSREWKTPIEQLKAIQLNDVLRVTYEKLSGDTVWHTALCFKRAKRSLYTRITVEPLGADGLIEVKTPVIVSMLQKRFGNVNEKKKTKKGIVPGNVATKDDIERVLKHIDEKASFAQGGVELKPSFMAMCLDISEKQMRRNLANPKWRKKVGFPGEFTDAKVFKRWAEPFMKSRQLNKAARKMQKNRIPGVVGRRQEDY